MSRRHLLPLLLALTVSSVGAQERVTFARFEYQGRVALGVVDGQVLRELRGTDLFARPVPTGRRIPLDRVRLLPPVTPGKVIAVGLNYKSHLGERPSATWPGLFAKLPTSIIATGDTIVLPADANNTHYEGEMVLVIGKRASRVPKEQALSHVFGITAGNDVSERDWQRSDLQWFRAKATDTFGPLGPWVVTGLNPDDVLVQTRQNGTVVQSQRTKDLIFDVATIVSYISNYVTLEPGDVIYTGTPGTTKAIAPGDVVEIEVEGVGVLRNPVRRAR